MQGIGASNDQLLFEKSLKGNIFAQGMIHFPKIFSGDGMRKIIIALILSLSLLSVTKVLASPLTNITENRIILEFPETATFRATLTDEVDITLVVLEYGNKQETCGEVVAKAFPQFTPSKTVNAEWTWERSEEHTSELQSQSNLVC